MTLSLFRWVWQLEGPMHVGMPPAGSLNRTRLYVPARALWGALTAELARQEAEEGKEPEYQSVGASLQKDYRLTYLFPAEGVEGTWRAWLPNFRDAMGLAWAREDLPEQTESDRRFRRRLLSTRPGTSIDAGTDASDDGSLRETECIECRWRDEQGVDAGPVAMVGYLLMQADYERPSCELSIRSLESLETLFVGGDTRYGLGRLRRIGFDQVSPESVFGASVVVDDGSMPRIESKTALAHAHTEEGTFLKGGLELVAGWDRGAVRSLHQAVPLWQPGSTALTSVLWVIEPDGTWRRER